MFCRIKTFGLQLQIFAITELNNAPKLQVVWANAPGVVEGHRGCPASFNGHQNKTADIGRKAVSKWKISSVYNLNRTDQLQKR